MFGLNQLQSLLFDEEDDEDSMRAISENKNQMQAGMNPMAQQGGLMGAANQGKEQKQILSLRSYFCS